MLPSGLHDHIGDHEDLARFLIHSNWFNFIAVKQAAFLPNPKDRETSVSRHGREPLDGLWKIGLVAAGSRRLYGAATLKARDVRSAQLDVFPDEPPPRHAAIRKWPWEADPELQKAKQKELALLLVSAAGAPLLR